MKKKKISVPFKLFNLGSMICEESTMDFCIRQISLRDHFKPLLPYPSYDIDHIFLAWFIYYVLIQRRKIPLSKLHLQEFGAIRTISLIFIPHLTETNQGKIVEAGGLTSLLTLLKTSQDETIHRVAAGAIANLAMNGKLVFFLFFATNYFTK